MKAQFVRKLWMIFMGMAFLCPLNVLAAEGIAGYENWYDVESLIHYKIGYSSVKIYPAKYNGEPVYKLEGTFHLSYSKLFSKYVFHYTDAAIVDSKGVLNYEIDENDDGKLRFISARRKDGKLEVTTYNKKGGAIIDKKNFNVADYDYTQFEKRFPISFAKFKIGQIKHSRVFIPSQNMIITSDVTAREIKNVSWNGETKRVLVLETTSKEDDKTLSKTTSWIMENGELLFSEEKKYSLHLTTKEKALGIK